MKRGREAYDQQAQREPCIGRRFFSNPSLWQSLWQRLEVGMTARYLEYFAWPACKAVA